MTTVAWDGETMSADTLATDAWGMKEEVRNKILRGSDFLLGCAGEHGQIMRWWRSVEQMSANDLLMAGYFPYEKDTNDPALMLVCANGGLYRHTSGIFTKLSRNYHAIGSGRDYALGAMHFGADSISAVRVAIEFDNGTGGEIITERFKK